jgi:hypothetical protein
MRVLFVADLGKGRTGSQRCAAMHRLGHSVTEVDTSKSRATGFRRARELVDKIALRLGYRLDIDGLSRRVLAAARSSDADILWLDKVLSLSPAFFEAFKAEKAGRKIVIYHPDDFKSRFNWSRHYNRQAHNLDLIVTTKSYNVAEFKALGHKNILFLNKSFDPIEHAPPVDHDRTQLRANFAYDVGFVGGYEKDRADLICGLARRGITVHVVGSFWDRGENFPENVIIEHGDLGPGDYARRIFATKINLAFLRKQNRDLQTARSFEIPASGGFMLSESTDELRGLFREGIDAEFFSSADELYQKCVDYLADDTAREIIARQGCRHVWEGKSRTDDIISTVIETLTAQPD